MCIAHQWLYSVQGTRPALSTSLNSTHARGNVQSYQLQEIDAYVEWLALVALFIHISNWKHIHERSEHVYNHMELFFFITGRHFVRIELNVFSI